MAYVGIDPSTKTGFVILDERGNVRCEKEITAKSKNDPERFIEITEHIFNHIKPDDKIGIEGFAYGAKGKGVSVQYGIGWAIRIELKKRGFTYTEITPSSLKKFATGKGNTKKEDMILPIYKRWQYENKSDNIRDAYILAQIMRYLDGHGTPIGSQTEVLQKI